MHSFSKKGKTKKPLHRHQESAGALLSLQNDVLCNGFEIQRRDCFRTHSLANSTKTHRVVGVGIFSQHTAGIGWLCHISILHRIQLCPSFKGTILYHKTRRKSRNLRRVLNIFRICGEYYLALRYHLFIFFVHRLK